MRRSGSGVGIRRIERPSDGHGARARAEFTNAIRRWVKDNTRLGATVSRATRPLMELKGFRRISLTPGEPRPMTFELGPEQLSYHGSGMKRLVEPGRFQVMVGGSSDEVKSVGLDVVGQLIGC